MVKQLNRLTVNVRDESRGTLRKSSLRKKIRDVDSLIVQSLNEQRKREEDHAIQEISQNPKTFFTFANKRKKTPKSIGPLEDDGGVKTSDPKEMANLLAREYANAFSVPKKSALLENPKEFFDTDGQGFGGFNDILVTLDEVRTALKSFKSGAAPGPDGVPTDVLIQCADELAPALTSLYQRSFDTGEIPEILKVSKIVPLHKGNSRHQMKNYRPISLTSHLGKGMEKVLKKHLVNYLESENLLNEHQHGFRAQRSTFSQMAKHVDEIFTRLEEGGLVDVVYLDFARAFGRQGRPWNFALSNQVIEHHR